MKGERLRKNVEFRSVYRRGKSFSNDILVLYLVRSNRNRDENGRLYNKVGISVSKKVGKSITRSRAKRLINESYRLNSKGLRPGHNLVFVARSAIKEKEYKDVQTAMLNLFKKAGIYNNDEKDSN